MKFLKTTDNDHEKLYHACYFLWPLSGNEDAFRIKTITDVTVLFSASD